MSSRRPRGSLGRRGGIWLGLVVSPSRVSRLSRAAVGVVACAEVVELPADGRPGSAADSNSGAVGAAAPGTTRAQPIIFSSVDHALLEPAREVVAQRLRMRVVFVDRVVELRNQSLDQRDLLFGDSQPPLRLAEASFWSASETASLPCCEIWRRCRSARACISSS